MVYYASRATLTQSCLIQERGLRARPGVRIFSVFLFFVTRAVSLLQERMRESSGPLLRCSSRRRRGDVSGGDEGLAHVDDGILEGDVVDAEDFLRGRVDKGERNAKGLEARGIPFGLCFVGRVPGEFPGFFHDPGFAIFSRVGRLK